MLSEIGLKALVNEFATIIGTEYFYLGGELGLNHGMKCLEYGENSIFSFQLVEPCHLSAIINKNYKPTITRGSSYWGWSPHIEVYQGKWNITFIQAYWITDSMALSHDTCTTFEIYILQT